MMKHLFFTLILILAILLAGCAAAPEDAVSVETPSIRNDIAAAAAAAELTSGEAYAADIRLSADGAEITGSGAVLDGDTLRITQPGVYRLAGEYDGAVVVDCEGDAELVLCGLRLRGARFALYAKSCTSLTVTTVPDCGQSYLSQSDPDGGIALECSAPLTLRGSGWLTLQAAGDGLRVKDSFLLQSGSLTVNAADTAVKADRIELSGGSTTVASDGDAIRADDFTVTGGTLALTAGDEAVDADTVTVTGGVLTISAEGNAITADTITLAGGSGTICAALDALQAAQDLTVSAGEYTVTTANGAGMAYYHVDSGGTGNPGGGRSGSSSTSYTLPDYSCKALKSDASIHLTGGTLTLDSEDDAIHAATELVIDGAALSVRSNDDAIHCDKNLTINSGSILISSCFEGIEAEVVTINGGYADIYAANDGINTSSAVSDGFGFGESSAAFYMNGGEAHVYVFGSSNVGDGVDSNGVIEINGGYLTSSTLGGSMENGLDSGSSFVVNGGIVASSGNSGMQESAASSSAQCTAVLSVDTIAEGTECVVTDEAGAVVMTYTPYRACTALIFSHPDFAIGKTYTLTAGSYTQSFTFDSVSYSDRGGFGGGPGGRPF